MNAKKTIRHLEAVLFHAEQNMIFWNNVKQKDLQEQRCLIQSEYDNHNPDFLIELEIYNDKLEEVEEAYARIHAAHEDAMQQLTKIEKMNRFQKLWIA